MFSKIINLSVKIVRRYLPEPFVFAIILTLVAFVCAIPITKENPLQILENWGDGIWSLLGFAMQMALVIVCGSALAEAPFIKKNLSKLASMLSSPTSSIATVTIVSSVACWINWGFGLIVGVIFATYNLILVFIVILALTITNTLMHPKGNQVFTINPELLKEICTENNIKSATNNNEYKSMQCQKSTPADKLNESYILSAIIAIMGFLYLFLKLFIYKKPFDLNTAILLFLLLGVVFYGTPIKYVKAIAAASRSCSGIILQFPFYAGIMGIMTATSESGISLAGEISKGCISIANEHTFPVLSFLSAGIVNVFVPSGGGQWAVQGPIMIPAGVELGVNPAITGMAIAWGDAWTNLIQPFWAIPALAIAKLDARDIMGYCLIDLFIVGIIICLTFLMI